MIYLPALGKTLQDLSEERQLLRQIIYISLLQILLLTSFQCLFTYSVNRKGTFIYRTVSKLTERKSQLARFAFYTVPITLGAVGWMGGVELGKSFLGKDSLLAWAGGAVIPGGIFGIWRRALHKGVVSSAVFAAIGMAYQHSTNNNFTNTFLFHNLDNPNTPHPWNPFTRDYSAWNISQQGTDKEWSHISESFGINAKDPGPSWKKWEDEK